MRILKELDENHPLYTEPISFISTVKTKEQENPKLDKKRSSVDSQQRSALQKGEQS